MFYRKASHLLGTDIERREASFCWLYGKARVFTMSLELDSFIQWISSVHSFTHSKNGFLFPVLSQTPLSSSLTSFPSASLAIYFDHTSIFCSGSERQLLPFSGSFTSRWQYPTPLDCSPSFLGWIVFPKFICSSLHPHKPEWDCIWRWAFKEDD